MTKRLQEALRLAESLPPDKQDRLAAIVLEEIASECDWDERFATTADKLERLAKQAIERDERGETKEQGWDEL